ncbi:single-stranded DNA-binding protein [Thalassiella azotivora]
MRDVTVTVVGNVGADPVVHKLRSGDEVTRFSVGSTPRVLDRGTGEWGDGPTTWYRVSCWRQLGANVADSLRRGERVVVVGRLRVSTWEQDGAERKEVEVVADHVGHELSFGTTRYQRVVREAALPQAGADDAAGDPFGEPAVRDLDGDHEGPESDGASDGAGEEVGDSRLVGV